MAQTVTMEYSEALVADDGYWTDASSIDSDFTSIASSIRNYVYENGRRYHSLNAGKYVMPNDESEQDRLEMGHHTISLILEGELQLVKLPEKLDRVLDLGTGTGIWAIDFADSHPETQVIGVDLSPIQPLWVPSNCSFEVDDIEEQWVWKEPFDYIHSAYLAQGVRDWPKYVKQMYDALVPGGVVQLLEVNTRIASDDDSIPKGGYIERYHQAFHQAAEMEGLQHIPPLLAGFLQKAGFVDIAVKVKKGPQGPWPKDPRKKEMGRWGLKISEKSFESYGIALLTHRLGMGLEEAKDLCQNAFKELCRRDVHTYYEQWFVEGRKPYSR